MSALLVRLILNTPPKKPGQPHATPFSLTITISLRAYEMDVETHTSKSTVVSKPIIHLPAQYLESRLDVSAQRKLSGKYPNHYLSDTYLPGPPSFTGFGERDSNILTFDNTSRTTDGWSTAGPEIAHPQPRAIITSANLLSQEMPSFFNPAPEPRSSSPTTVNFRRTSNPTARQRTAHACDSCRGRKTKCSGEQPACQRCTARGLTCHYGPARTSRWRNPPNIHHRGKSASIKANDHAKVGVVIPQPASRSTEPYFATTSASNTLTQVPKSVVHTSSGWIPSHDMFYAVPGSGRRLNENGSGLGLTGIYTKPASTVTKDVTHDLPSRTSQNFTPAPSASMFTHTVTSPGTFHLGQRMSWNHQKHVNIGYETEAHDASPPRLTISLEQYEVPLVAPAPGSTRIAHSSESSPVSSNSSPSSENSSVPSLPAHDLKTPSPVGDVQFHYLPGEDFRFLSDPAYCEYLVKSTVIADGGRDTVRFT